MATDFNVDNGVKVARKLLMTYVDVSDGSTPEWEIVGRGVEESAIELNPETETVTDILGITETSITKWEATQTFEPNTVRGGSKLNMKLHQIWQDKTPEKLTQFKVLLVYAYLGTSNKFEAEMHKGCTVNPTSIGGSAFVDMPIEITYSNDIAKGTVSMSDGNPTFTANS
jgi:hypothetical protein